MDGHPALFQRFDEIEQPIQRVEIRAGLCDLRTDVAIDADDFQAWQGSGAQVSGDSTLVRDAELVGLQASGNVGVRLGIHVRIDAQADTRAATCPDRDLREDVELGVTLDVETHHIGVERLLHLRTCLAHAREQHFGGLATGSQHAFKLAARDDIEAATRPREGLQHREVGVGLHRIADEVVAPHQRALVAGQRLEHRGPGIHVQRCSKAARQIVQRTIVDEQLATSIGNVR